MSNFVGPGTWVMFIDADGAVSEGRAISGEERLGPGPAVIWVDVQLPDGHSETAPVLARGVRPVARL